MEKFIIHRNKWRCGNMASNEQNRLGLGKVALLNNEGYMCCLGQCLHQLGYPKSQLLNYQDPYVIDSENAFVAKADRGFFDTKASKARLFVNTELSKLAMEINDDFRTSVSVKEKRLKRLFKQHGKEIEFV